MTLLLSLSLAHDSLAFRFRMSRSISPFCLLIYSVLRFYRCLLATKNLSIIFFFFEFNLCLPLQPEFKSLFTITHPNNNSQLSPVGRCLCEMLSLILKQFASKSRSKFVIWFIMQNNQYIKCHAKWLSRKM